MSRSHRYARCTAGTLCLLGLLGCLGPNEFFNGPVGESGTSDLPAGTAGSDDAGDSGSGGVDASTSAASAGSASASTSTGNSTSGASATGGDTTGPADTSDTSADGCVVSSEVCDGIDNDCDDKVDEYSDGNGSCNDCEFRPWQGHVYAFCRGNSTWFEAVSACEAFGSELATIDDATENDVLFETQQNWPDTLFWIGLNELDEEDSWEWVDGTPMGYANFDPTEPNDANGDQDCTVISAIDGEWHDLHCNNDSPVQTATGWICEDSQP